MRPTHKYCVRVIAGPLVGCVFTLEDRLEIGRAASCHIQLVTRGTSRSHATIVLTDGGVFVVDTLSTNGTWVHGRKVQRERLRVGSRIRVAESELLLDAFETKEADGSPPMDRILDSRTTSSTQNFGFASTLGTTAVAAETDRGPFTIAKILPDIVLYRTLRLKMTRNEPCSIALRTRFDLLQERLLDMTSGRALPRTFHGELKGKIAFDDSRSQSVGISVRSIAVDSATVDDLCRTAEVDAVCWLALPLIDGVGLRAVVLTARVSWARSNAIGVVLSGAPTWPGRLRMGPQDLIDSTQEMDMEMATEMEVSDDDS